MKNSLLRRNIRLLVGVVLAGQLLAGAMVLVLVLRPQTIRVADISAHMLNTVSLVMQDQPPAERARIVQNINDDASISLRRASDPPGADGRAFPNFLERMFMRALAQRLSSQDAIQWRTDAERHLWMEVDLGGEPYWVNITPPRIAGPLLSLFIAMLIAFLVAVAGGLLLQRRLDRPLRALVRGVASYVPGSSPPRIIIDGPQEITDVAHAFNDMANRIDTHEQERTMMLAGVSHDLRTPLARLRLSVEMMPHDDEVLRESAHRQIEQIDHMLGQFLDYARSGGDEAPQPVYLCDLLATAAQDAGMADVSIDAEPDLTFMLRPFAIRRAIKNLLENAGRYGVPPVSLRARKGPAELVIEIIDQGAGFDPAMTEHFCKPFTKVDTARSKQGTGLGLAIAHGLIEREGGGLTFSRSELGFVARITFYTGNSSAVPECGRNGV
ncbi:MAG: ATP-binding protein [Parasphingorhabdus sp.]|uniref:ATP-binding protein n=1 Tax=Parasphingorhabdus sp. TaxID=2709688 RepID=UPI0030018850